MGAKTLVTGGTGFVGLHVARELARRGDELRLLVREQSNLEPLEGIEFERAVGDVTDREAVRKAMKGVERVFHVAGTTSMRSRARDRVFEVNVEGTRNVMEEALRAGVLRAVLTSSSSAVGAARPGETIDETQPFTVGKLGIAYINSKHEAELVSMRVAAKGLPVVIVNPSFVLGPDDPNPSGTSNALIRRLLLRRDARLPRRRDQHRRRPGRRQGPRARRRARGGRRALPAHRAKLHPAAALRRSLPAGRRPAAARPHAEAGWSWRGCRRWS